MRIGIDLGGTKIEGIAIDSDGAERARRRISTPAGDYEGTLNAIIQVVNDIEDRVGSAKSVGIGIPGAQSLVTGLIKNANSTCLIGQALDQDLQDRLDKPVKLANDANCFCISEATDGVAQGCDVVFGVILGTGVGGGIVVNGRLIHTGKNAIAGEWGHNPLPWPEDTERPGPTCYCGKSGCIETFLSGSGLVRTYDGTNQSNTPTAAMIAEMARAGDVNANRALAMYENRLARALASVINILDPDIIVLGGGLSNIQRLYDTVPELWQQWVFSDRVDTPLKPNQHGDSSGVRGAAWL